MWIVSGTYVIKPGKRDAFVEQVIAQGILDKILKEDGNIGYDYYYPLEDADQVFFVERWISEAAWKAHLEAPHVAQDLKALKESYQDGFLPGVLGALTEQ